METDESGYCQAMSHEVTEAWISWVHGHHLMHIELAWMRDLLQRAKAKFDAGDARLGELLMTRFRRLLVASGATMRYTGSFSEDVYLRFIRPAMPPGDFSGVYNIEHTGFQSALGPMKRYYKAKKDPINARCPFAARRDDGLPETAEIMQLANVPGETGILAAEILSLTDHSFVCREMVADRPSKMDEFSRDFNSETQAGWEKLLSRLKTKMKQLVQGAKHAA